MILALTVTISFNRRIPVIYCRMATVTCMVFGFSVKTPAVMLREVLDLL
jgi:hypothetical protein